MLLAYKIHLGKKSAWSVGIKGNGEGYGSVFHKHISRVFFDAASKPYHPLHANIRHAVSGGASELESVIREYIFFPFVEKNSTQYASGQIISMAKGVTVWVKAMSEFFRCIPSLTRHPDSESNMQCIFAEPEYKLRSNFDFNDGRIYITGCYDALMFNPDTQEMRLFEFKGYRKSDITVPLSQSLIYSWLIWRKTGIVSSIEIIYLDEGDKQPDIFDANSVCNMMSPALPGLFRSAFDILTLRRKPEILQNKELCKSCKYRNTCRKDMTKLFAKTRTGASLVNVLVFFLIALTITAQAFFFLENSAESLSEEREIMQVRLKLDALVDEAKEHIKTVNSHHRKISLWGKEAPARGSKYPVFSDSEADGGTLVYDSDDVRVFDLYYTLMNNNDDETSIGSSKWEKNELNDMYRRIYPPSKEEGYFLIRARQKLSAGNYMMYQIVVKKNRTDTPIQKSFEEVFYW